MRLCDFLPEQAIDLQIAGPGRDDILAQLVHLLATGPADAAVLQRRLLHRESLGSTGVGYGVGIPHCRTPLVDRLRLAYGRHLAGVPFDAVDGQPVHHFFLIVAPPVEVSNTYLPMLGRIAQLVKEPDVPPRLMTLTQPAELLALFDEKGF